MVKKLRFEDRLERLEGIVRGLEDGELGLEEAVSRYQDGVKLLRELRGHLETLEKRIDVLTAEGEERPLESDEDEGDEA